MIWGWQMGPREPKNDIQYHLHKTYWGLPRKFFEKHWGLHFSLWGLQLKILVRNSIRDSIFWGLHSKYFGDSTWDSIGDSHWGLQWSPKWSPPKKKPRPCPSPLNLPGHHVTQIAPQTKYHLIKWVSIVLHPYFIGRLVHEKSPSSEDLYHVLVWRHTMRCK